MWFDRLDICQAHFMFASLFHGGQGCPIYGKFAQLERLRFRPSPCLSQPSDLEGNARAIYQALVEKHCGIKSTAPN